MAPRRHFRGPANDQHDGVTPMWSPNAPCSALPTSLPRLSDKGRRVAAVLALAHLAEISGRFARAETPEDWSSEHIRRLCYSRSACEALVPAIRAVPYGWEGPYLLPQDTVPNIWGGTMPDTTPEGA